MLVTPSSWAVKLLYVNFAVKISAQKCVHGRLWQS